MRGSPNSSGHDEDGAILILAVVFVLVVGLIAIGLVGITESNLLATEKLTASRSTRYAADGALESAIASLVQIRRRRTRAVRSCLVSITAPPNTALTANATGNPLVWKVSAGDVTTGLIGNALVGSGVAPRTLITAVDPSSSTITVSKAGAPSGPLNWLIIYCNQLPSPGLFQRAALLAVCPVAAPSCPGDGSSLVRATATFYDYAYDSSTHSYQFSYGNGLSVQYWSDQ